MFGTAIICKANVNLPTETSHKVRFFKFAQWKLKNNSFGRPKYHVAGRKKAEILPRRQKNHAAGTLRPAPDAGRTNGYGKGLILRGGP